MFLMLQAKKYPFDDIIIPNNSWVIRYVLNNIYIYIFLSMFQLSS